MAQSRRRGRGSYGDGQPPKDDGPHDGEKPQGPGNPDADPVRIHREYIERRTGGGAPPTPERYRKALEQWHALPGSVRRPPIDLTEEQETGSPKHERDGEHPGRSTK
jgi:hypothetical protein